MAQTQTYSTRDLSGKRVLGGKGGTRRIGKVRRFVFHPTKPQCIGFIVKRPDLLLMFHRKDMFVSWDGFEITDEGAIRIKDEEKNVVGPAACKRLGVDWDCCIMWEGMPVVTQDQTVCGTVGTITLTCKTGKVQSFTVDKGATAHALLGNVEVPAEDILGFRTGIGVSLAQLGEEGRQEDDAIHGAILVSNNVLSIASEGGLAEKAGAASAVAADKAGKTVAKAKPKVMAATKVAGDAVNKGAYATGKQIARSKGMFGAFKDEYNKAAHPEKSKGSK